MKHPAHNASESSKPKSNSNSRPPATENPEKKEQPDVPRANELYEEELPPETRVVN